MCIASRRLIRELAWAWHVVAVHGCQPFYAQCGGNGWLGGTQCCGSTCYRNSEYHSQCRDDCPPDWECARSQQLEMDGQSWFTPSNPGKNPFEGVSLTGLEQDPRMQTLFSTLKIMAGLLVLVCCSFLRIRMRALQDKVRASRDPDQCGEEAMQMMSDAAPPARRKAKAKQPSKPQLQAKGSVVPRSGGRGDASERTHSARPGKAVRR